jgi:hypothetical protein
MSLATLLREYNPVKVKSSVSMARNAVAAKPTISFWTSENFGKRAFMVILTVFYS